MSNNWNATKIALYAGILGAVYVLLISSHSWDLSAGSIAGHVGETLGAGLGAATIAGVIAVVRNALVFRPR